MGFVEKSHRSQARGLWYEARGKPFPLVTSRSVPLARALGQEPSESCGLGDVVRVYQCQIGKKPVNSPMRSVEPTRHLSGGILSSKEHGMGSQHTEFHRSACLIDACGT